MGGRENGVVRRVGAGHNQVDTAWRKGGSGSQGGAGGGNGHGVGIFAGGRLAALLDAGALNYPLAGQAIETSEMRVGDDGLREVGRHMMKVHGVVLGEIKRASRPAKVRREARGGRDMPKFYTPKVGIAAHALAVAVAEHHYPATAARQLTTYTRCLIPSAPGHCHASCCLAVRHRPRTGCPSPK